MDPISIITLCASATVSAYNVSQTLYSFINSSRNVDSEVESLAAEVAGVRRVLDAIGVIFANPLIRSEKATSEENAPIWAAVAGALNECRISIERFDNQLTGTKKPVGKNFFKQAVKWTKLSYRLDDISKVRFQMNTHANNLQISLQMVSILVSSIGPQQSSVTYIGSEYSQLEQSISELTLVESKLPPDERKELQHQTEYLKKTANAVLGGLNGSSIALDKKDQQDSKQFLSRVVADFNRSVYEQGDDASTLADYSGDEDEDGHDNDNLEHELAHALFQKAEAYFKDKYWRLAETVLREGFQHLETIVRGGEDFDVVRAQLLLIQCCMHQDKWNEAELMLMILIRPSPGAKISLATLQAYHFLGQVHLCLYDFNSAVNYCRQALEGRRRMLGKNHPTTMSSLQLLALIHRANGDAVSADAYAKLITIPQEELTENGLVIPRFEGYSTADQLRTTLAEKAFAIRELMKKGFVGQIKSSSSEENARQASTPVTIKFNPSLVDIDYSKAIWWAIDTDLEIVVRWLLSRRADPNARQNRTPALVVAAAGGHAEVVATLLAAGAAINGSDGSNRTAVLWSSLWGYNATLRVLLERGADADEPDTDGATPLMDATVKGHESTVRMLLKYGVKLETKNNRGSTALHLAVDRGETEVCRALIEYGADVNARNAQQQTPLLVAASERRELSIRLLVDAGADVHARDADDATALRNLAPSGDVRSLRLLLAKGADVDAADKSGCTALIQCADSGYSGVLSLMTVLLEHGADLQRVCDGRNALETAKRRRNQECVNLLESFQAKKAIGVHMKRGEQ